MFKNFFFLVGNGNAGDFREFTYFELSIRRWEESNTRVSSLYQSVKHDDFLHDNPLLSDSVFWENYKRFEQGSHNTMISHTACYDFV